MRIKINNSKRRNDGALFESGLNPQVISKCRLMTAPENYRQKPGGANLLYSHPKGSQPFFKIVVFNSYVTAVKQTNFFGKAAGEICHLTAYTIRTLCCASSAKVSANAFIAAAVSYTHLRAHETRHDLVCRLLL